MADIRPFRALRYDPAQVSASQVVTQPYDKITPAMQERYYSASPYNLVRIVLGRPTLDDTSQNNVYSRAAADFRAWREKGVLRQDPTPSIYAYFERFQSPGGSGVWERKSFIALGRVEDYAKNVVFRHEQTLAKPKADRLDLLRATRAHFELLFMLYEDSGEINSSLEQAANATPNIDVTDEYGVMHRVWQISDANLIKSVRNQMRDQKLVIADGHHRYETALNYRNECRGADSEANSFVGSNNAPYEFVPMAFVNMNSQHLLILPTHRVVHSLSSFSADSFLESAQAYFDVEEVDAGRNEIQAKVLEYVAELNVRFGRKHEEGSPGTELLAVTANRSFFLRTPPQPKPAAIQALSGLSQRQQALDVVQLHKCLLEGVLKLSEESIRNQQNLSYIRDAGEAIAQVREGKANIAFLMNPCRVQQVRDIAFAGEVMPQKSTDFYPKLLSGLTIYALD
ncbi:MAG TPA: DUF1015 domain-containing protein [Candidatus Sulfotelmatobacter sp.]|nr:DUF1015 domain-containing protein [Candidatus Sulfotelmatobacter sp.]